MSTTTDRLDGTAHAPLAATRRYEFSRARSADDRPTITIPVHQRGTWDDYGVVDHAEQERWLWDFAISRGAQPQSGWPGEFIWPDAAARDLVWDALSSVLRPPTSAPPSVTLERAVGAAEARAVSEVVTQRFCALVSALYGCDARRFECLGSERSNDPSAPLRAGLWKCEGVAGPVFFRVLSEGDASDVDIRDATFVIDTGDAYGRTARAHARIDARTGGTMSVTVSGVLDAQRLAERWLHGA